MEEVEKGGGRCRTGSRHNKPFHGRQNIGPGAAITETQRAASLCGATWQSARAFDKGGGPRPTRFSPRSTVFRLSALSS